MAIKKSKLSWIVVSDFNKAKKFFNETLELEMSACDENYGWAELAGKEGGSVLGLSKASEYCPVNSGCNAVMTFTVDNLEETRADLLKKGVNMIGEVVEVPGHVKLQTFTDPDGNVFQLVEEMS